MASIPKTFMCVNVSIFQEMKKKIAEAEKLLKYFVKMSEAIRDGEDSYSLDDANLLRVKVLKLHEQVDGIRFGSCTLTTAVSCGC